MNKGEMIIETYLLTVLQEYANLTWFIAMGASDFMSAPIEQITEVIVDKLFELRAFNDEHEIHIVRGNLGDAFQVRDSLDYHKRESSDLFIKEEEHYLDIDIHKYTIPNQIVKKEIGYIMAGTMAGGSYGLPSRNTKKVKIENYYYPDEKGFYYSIDFRIVKFLEV